jgi:hypothetical protein
MLLDLAARSSVADFGYLPLVNALIGSLGWHDNLGVALVV